MQSGCSRVHASDQPFVAFLFQCRDILIPGIYKDSFFEDDRIRNRLDIFFRDHPLFSGVHGSNPGEIRIVFQMFYQGTVPAVEFGHRSVCCQVERYSLEAFDAQRVGYTAV